MRASREVLTKEDVAIGSLLYPEHFERPRVRSECEDGQRPCPYVGCRYHLYLDVPNQPKTKRYKKLQIYHPTEPWNVHKSCALDVAEEGYHTLDEIGEILNCTRERVRQIISIALSKLEIVDDRIQRKQAQAQISRPG